MLHVWWPKALLVCLSQWFDSFFIRYFPEVVRGMMYYRRALMLQSYLEKGYLGGSYTHSSLFLIWTYFLDFIIVGFCSTRYWGWQFFSRICWHTRLRVVSWLTGPSRYKVYLCCFMPDIWTTEAKEKIKGLRYCSFIAKVNCFHAVLVYWWAHFFLLDEENLTSGLHID